MGSSGENYDQLSLLAPHPTGVVLGSFTVAIAEGVYATPPLYEHDGEALSEVSRLAREHQVLDNFAADLEDNKSINQNARTRAKLFENNQNYEQQRLLTKAIEAIEKKIAIRRLASKGIFGASIGIATEQREQIRRNEDGSPRLQAGIPVTRTEIVALDPARQVELNDKYSDFRRSYQGINNRSRRNARRTQIKKLIKVASKPS